MKERKPKFGEKLGRSCRRRFTCIVEVELLYVNDFRYRLVDLIVMLVWSWISEIRRPVCLAGTNQQKWIGRVVSCQCQCKVLRKVILIAGQDIDFVTTSFLVLGYQASMSASQEARMQSRTTG